jgi:ATP-dependent Zn protease
VRILNDATAIEEAGGYLPKGVILYGPPGVGKTYLAKAAANASSKPLILYPPGATASTFMGIAELKIFMLFREVRKQARRHGGVIVFYDEIDVMGSRGGMIGGMLDKLGMNRSAVKGSYQHFLSGSAYEERAYEGCVPYDPDEPTPIFISNQSSQALTTFLAAMDGMEEPRGFLNKMLKMLGFKPIPPPQYRYMMLGATNRLEVLDPALLRAGRFGRKVQVDYPRVDGRRRTYEGYLGKVNNTLTEDEIAWVAQHDHQGSGASIKDVVNEAVLLTFRDGRDTPGVVTFEDVTKAMSIIKFGEPGDMWEREEAVWGVAVHEAGHAVAFHYLNRDRQDIWIASILPRGTKGGFVAPTSRHDDWLLTREQLLADVQISLASRVAEGLVLGQASNGHGGDGKAATQRAAKMVTLGHGSQIGAYDKDEVAMGLAIEDILQEAQHRTYALLLDKRAHIRAVANLLVQQGEVRGTEIHELLDEMDGVLKV